MAAHGTKNFLSSCSLTSLLLAMPAAVAQEASSSHSVETVVVTGKAKDGYRVNTVESVGPLGAISAKDTPYALTVTPGELIENMDAHTLADALKTNPSVFVSQTPFADGRGMTDSLIRGFAPMYMRDGMYFNSYNMPSLENVERLEVMNGLTGFMYGFANPGGAINYVTKQPSEDRIATVKFGGYGGGQWFGNGDFGGAIDDGKKLTFRADLYASGGSTYIDQQKYRSLLGMANMRYRLAPESWVQIHYYHNEFHQGGAQVQFILDPATIAIPAVPNPSTLYGQSWTKNSVSSEQEGLEFQSKLSDIFTARFAYNHSNMMWHRESLAAKLTDNLGNYTETFRYYGPQHYVTDTGYSLIDAAFHTGSIAHVLTFGYWGSNEQDDDAPGGSQLIGTSTIKAPATIARPSVAISDVYSSYSAWFYNSIVLGDRISFDEHWSAIVGANLAWYDARYINLTTKVITNSFSQNRLSPSVSVVYKPISDVSLYATYMEAMSGGNRAPDTYNGIAVVNAQQLLAPAVSRQYEFGSKATLGNIDLSAALFYIDKANAEVDPADYIYKADGREIHQGFEFYATGKLTDDLTLTGGFTVLNAAIDKALAIPANAGKTPANVPEVMGSLRAEYAVPVIRYFYLSGSFHYTGSRPANTANAQFLREVATFDLGLRYEPEIADHRVVLSLNVTNLFDERYWASCNARSSDGGGLQFGAPRLVAFSVKTGL